MAGKRDNAYYLQRLKKDWPAVYREVQAGRMNLPEARRRAGLGGHRTRLHELKNAWTHATPSERSQFVSWARSTLPAPALVPTTKTAWSSDNRMLDWAKRRVLKIMGRLNLSYAQLADQLGISRLDASLAGALARDNRVKSPATRAALDRWLDLNAAV